MIFHWIFREGTMLVLSRKRTEVVVIDGGIEVHVLEIRGDKVKLGFIAPREVNVARREVWTGRKEADHAA
jgi:carbon storage regulator